MVTQGNVTELEYSKLARIQNYGWGDPDTTEGDSCSDSMQCDNIFGVDPFYIEKGNYIMHHAFPLLNCFEEVFLRHCMNSFLLSPLSLFRGTES